MKIQMKPMVLIFAAAVLFTACSGEKDRGGGGKSEATSLNTENAHDAPDFYSAADVDEMIEDTWIDLNEEKPVAIPQWFADRQTRRIDWLDKETAIRIHGEVKQQFGVELSGLVSTELPDYTTSVIGRLGESTDLAKLKTYLLAAPSKYQLSVRLGSRWVMFDGQLDENGGLVSK